MKRPKIDFIDRMILIEYEQGESNFSGTHVRNRINWLKLKRFLAKRFNIKRKRKEANG